MKRFLVFLLMLVLLALPLASTADEDASQIDISKHVTLKMYVLGGEGGPHASDAVDAINAYATEKINASIEPAIISWGDWTTKYPAIFASGEAYDMIYASEWCYFKTEAPKGAFMALEDLLPIYAPKTLASLNPQAWQESTINGHIYLFPAALKEYTTHLLLIREDLRKKYDAPEPTTLDALGEYMGAIKANEPDMMPSQGISNYIFHYMMDWGRPLSNDSGEVSYSLKDPNTFFAIADTPEYEQWLYRMKDWADKGYWTKNILSVTDDARDVFKAGKIAALVLNLPDCNSIYRYVADSGLDWEVMAYSIEGDTKIERSSFIGNGTAINRNSPNPERALMFLELGHQDQKMYDLIHYGIEGVTYALEGDKVTIPAGADPAQLSLMNIGMAVNDPDRMRDRVGDWELVKTLENEFDKIAVVNPNCTYIFDREPVNAELAAIVNVCAQYKAPLDAGLVDVESGLATLREQLQKAGIQKVIDEFAKQKAGG